MVDIIDLNTPIKEARQILSEHCISMPFMWEIALGMLLQEHGPLKVVGYGDRAKFEWEQKEACNGIESI